MLVREWVSIQTIHTSQLNLHGVDGNEALVDSLSEGEERISIADRYSGSDTKGAVNDNDTNNSKSDNEVCDDSDDNDNDDVDTEENADDDDNDRNNGKSNDVDDVDDEENEIEI